MEKKAVIIFGPPGSGKGTQAELLAKKYNFIHFDTGRYSENLLNSKEVQKNKIFQREKKLFDAGVLLTPVFILKVISDATKKIAKANFGIIYSGSPRTLIEAIGDKKTPGLLKILKDNYQKENIKVIRIKVEDKTSIKRNSNRFVCSVCGLPVLAGSKNKSCIFCAGPLKRRILDDPNVIKVRLEEFKKRTLPIINQFKKAGLKVNIVNGEPAPYKVFDQIEKILQLGKN